MTLGGEVDTFLRRVEHGEAAAAVDGVLALHDSGLRCSDIIAEVLAPAQLEVGVRWATGRWSVADEHVATAVVDDVLGALAARLTRSHEGPTIALCSAEGEWHVTPLRMGALVLREAGWQVRMFGASTPAAHLQQTLRHAGADVAAIHCAVANNLHGVPDVVAAAHEVGLPVLAAGGGFGRDDHRARRLGCDGWAPDPRAGARLAHTWLQQPPVRRAPTPVPQAAAAHALHGRREQFLESALQELAPRLPAGPEQERGYREDVRDLLDAVSVTLLVDDQRLLEDFLAWRQVVLLSRGVPATTVEATVVATVAAVRDELPAAAALLDEASRVP